MLCQKNFLCVLAREGVAALRHRFLKKLGLRRDPILLRIGPSAEVFVRDIGLVLHVLVIQDIVGL